jgi:hypothetical protein
VCAYTRNYRSCLRAGDGRKYKSVSYLREAAAAAAAAETMNIK